MAEKNIQEEIKQKHEEFDRDIEEYLNQIKAQSQPQPQSPLLQRLRETANRFRTE